MVKPLRQIVRIPKDSFRSKTPWEGSHNQGKMKVAKVDHGGEHEKNFKAVDTKVYDREKDRYGNNPEPACADGSYGAAPDMAKEEVGDKGKEFLFSDLERKSKIKK